MPLILHSTRLDYLWYQQQRHFSIPMEKCRKDHHICPAKKYFISIGFAQFSYLIRLLAILFGCYRVVIMDLVIFPPIFLSTDTIFSRIVHCDDVLHIIDDHVLIVMQRYLCPEFFQLCLHICSSVHEMHWTTISPSALRCLHRRCFITLFLFAPTQRSIIRFFSAL